MGGRTSDEIMAEVERRQRDDHELRARLQREEAERAERVRLATIAEQPLVADLRAIGLQLNTVWDLYLIPNSRPQAIPVLLKHLALDYPDTVLQGIGIGLSDRSARAWWSELRTMMLSTERDVVRDRLAAVLSSCATREHYDDLLAFIRDQRLGEDRIYFLRPINRIGNRISAGQGRAVI